MSALAQLDAVACPKCSARVVVTKERVVFCSSCFTGYPIHQGIPDFRPENYIDFPKIARQNRHGGLAQVYVTDPRYTRGPQTLKLKCGSAVIVGRHVTYDVDSDVTYFGFDGQSRVGLHQNASRLIERFLTHDDLHESSAKALGVVATGQKMLGSFVREDDLLLDHASVSRSHAVLYMASDGLHVMDLISRNGTFLNHREVERAKLTHNDVLRVGAVNLKIKLR
jgi:uncharacterized protein YbaR (Trm112 family)